MANYGYIRTKKRINPARLDAELKAAAMPGWKVVKASWRDGGPTWLVHIPGTAARGRAAAERVLADGDDVGFAVALQDNRRTIAFRHGPNHFESWAQGCMEEALADAFGVGVYYDATGETRAPGAREYRRGSTYWEYLSRNFPRPLSLKDIAFLQRHAAWVPPGFDAGFTS